MLPPTIVTQNLFNHTHTHTQSHKQYPLYTFMSVSLYGPCFTNAIATDGSERKKVKWSLYTPWRRLGNRRYSSYSFLTSALEGGEWSASCSGRALPPGKEPPVPSVQEAGWAPDPVWTQRLEEKSSASVGDRPRPSSPWSDTVLTDLPWLLTLQWYVIILISLFISTYQYSVFMTF
jgi:hypothetical protein